MQNFHLKFKRDAKCTQNALISPNNPLHSMPIAEWLCFFVSYFDVIIINAHFFNIIFSYCSKTVDNIDLCQTAGSNLIQQNSFSSQEYSTLWICKPSLLNYVVGVKWLGEQGFVNLVKIRLSDPTTVTCLWPWRPYNARWKMFRCYHKLDDV